MNSAAPTTLVTGASPATSAARQTGTPTGPIHPFPHPSPHTCAMAEYLGTCEYCDIFAALSLVFDPSCPPTCPQESIHGACSNCRKSRQLDPAPRKALAE